jgi:hypothetical protein
VGSRIVLTLLNVDKDNKISRKPCIVLVVSSLVISFNPDNMKINDNIINTIIAIESPLLFLFLKEITANNGPMSIKIEQIVLEKVYVEIITKHNNKSIIINLYRCLCRFSIT